MDHGSGAQVRPSWLCGGLAALYFRENASNEAPDDLGARVRAAGGVADAQIMGDVKGAMDYLRAQANANGRIGVI